MDINETVDRLLNEGYYKDQMIDVADDMEALLKKNHDAPHVSKTIAKKYKLTIKQVNQAYNDSYGIWPSDYK